MTQAEDANLQFFIFHRTSDYSRHEPFARGCSTLGRRLHSALASSRSGRHRLTFASSGGRCATKAAKAGFCLPTKDGGREAALRNRTGGPAADDAGGPVGDLALGGGRKDPQLHDRHDDTERICARSFTTAWVLQPDVWPLWLGEQPADCRSSRRCWPLPFQ